MIETVIILAIYIIGVYFSFLKLWDWNKGEIYKPEDIQMLHAFSLLSWMAFVFYGIISLLNESDES